MFIKLDKQGVGAHDAKIATYNNTSVSGILYPISWNSPRQATHV